MDRLTRSLAAALLCTVAAALQAQSAPQPFLAPPRLAQKAAAGPNGVFMALPPAPPQPCVPDGDVSVQGNTVTVDLNVRVKPNRIRNPSDTTPSPVSQPHMDNVLLRSYGGCLTGPLIEVKPGNTLRVHLNNDLSATDPSCGATDPGCFNTINLHFHGMHVSPSGNSDNVLLNIAPKTKFEYEVNVPEDHPAGTFWYHAHRHGSTSLQVASGASGVLIVKGVRSYTGGEPGDIDTILHDAAGKQFAEQVFLFQQIPYACFLANDPLGPYQSLITSTGLMTAKTRQLGAWICPDQYQGQPVTAGVVESFETQLGGASLWDYSARFTSINGAVQPTLDHVAAGEIQRWRMIHGGIHDTVNVQIVQMVAPKNKLLAAMALSGNITGTPREQAKLIAEICPVTLPDGKSLGSIVPQFEIASDGLTESRLREIGTGLPQGGITSNFLQPGYRSDVLVAFPAPGRYCVLNQAAPADERPVPGKGGGGQGPSITQLLATVVVTGGTAVTGDMQTYIERALHDGNQSTPGLPPAALAGLLTGDLTPWTPQFALGKSSNEANPIPVEFKIGNDTAGNFGFFVNDKSYDPDRVDQTRQVGATEDWMLTATGTPGVADAEPHIFHIHVNPFEVVDVTDLKTGASIFGAGGTCLLTEAGLVNQYCGMWHKFKDTVFVQNGYQVRIRTKYDRYIGEYVIHCHILDHEDSGMMANVAIVPDVTAPNGGLGMTTMKHDHAMPNNMPGKK